MSTSRTSQRPGTSGIQSVLLPKLVYPTRRDAARWLAEHGKRADKIDDSGKVRAGRYWRGRQHDPSRLPGVKERIIVLGPKDARPEYQLLAVVEVQPKRRTITKGHARSLRARSSGSSGSSGRSRGGGGASLSTREREYAGELMGHWHGSQGDPIYAVGSFFRTGQKHPDPEVVERARANLANDLTKARKRLHGWGPEEVLELQTILALLDKELGEKVSIASGIDAMLDAYLRAILATETEGEDDRSLEAKGYSVKSFTKEALDAARRTVSTFARAHEGDIAGDWSRAGTDLWLVQSESGAGFGDGDWPDAEAEERLKRAAEKLPRVWVTAWRKKIHFSH